MVKPATEGIVGHDGPEAEPEYVASGCMWAAWRATKAAI